MVSQVAIPAITTQLIREAMTSMPMMNRKSIDVSVASQMSAARAAGGGAVARHAPEAMTTSPLTAKLMKSGSVTLMDSTVPPQMMVMRPQTVRQAPAMFRPFSCSRVDPSWSVVVFLSMM